MKADLRQRLDAVDRDRDRARRGARRRSTSSTARSCTFSENFACPEHGVSLPELEPRIFSFNSPHGACPRCTGLGAQLEIDPDLLVPGPVALDRRGRARPVDGRQPELLRVGHPGDRRALRDRRSTRRGATSTDEQQDRFLLRHGRRADLRHVPQPDGPQARSTRWRSRGIVTNLAAALPRDRLVARSASGSRST